MYTHINTSTYTYTYTYTNTNTHANPYTYTLHIHIQTQIPIHIHIHIHIYMHIDRVSTYTIPSESEDKAVQKIRKLWEEIEKPKLIQSKTIKNEQDLDFTDMSYLRLIRGDKLKVYI